MTNDEIKEKLEQEYLSLLINYFSTEFNMELFRIFINSLVEGSFLYSGLADILDIDKAEGAMLDFIGKNIVGLDRSAPERVVEGETIDYLFDSEYRTILKNGIFVKNIDYNATDIRTALSLIFGEGVYLKQENGSILYVFDEAVVDTFLVEVIVLKNLLPRPEAISVDILMIPKNKEITPFVPESAEYYGWQNFFFSTAPIRFVTKYNENIYYTTNDLVTEEDSPTGTQPVYRAIQGNVNTPLTNTSFWKVVKNSDLPVLSMALSYFGGIGDNFSNYGYDDDQIIRKDTLFTVIDVASLVLAASNGFTEYPIYYAKAMRDVKILELRPPNSVGFYSRVFSIPTWTEEIVEAYNNKNYSRDAHRDYPYGATIEYNGLYYTLQKTRPVSLLPPDQNSDWFLIGSEIPELPSDIYAEFKDIFNTTQTILLNFGFVWKYNNKLYSVAYPRLTTSSFFGPSENLYLLFDGGLISAGSPLRLDPEFTVADYSYPLSTDPILLGDKFSSFPAGYKDNNFLYNPFEDKTGMIYGDKYLIKE